MEVSGGFGTGRLRSAFDRRMFKRSGRRRLRHTPGVFAGDDIVRGAASVIVAPCDGKTSAKAIDEHLKKL